MSKPRILVDPGSWVRQEDWERLEAVCTLVRAEQPLDEAGLVAALAGCRGLIRLGGHLSEVTRAVIDGDPDFKILHARVGNLEFERSHH